MLIKLLWSTCFICLIFQSFSQDLLFKRYDNNDGLPSKEVYDLCLEKSGYLIAATEYGVVKFNGERFEPICLNIALADRIFYSLKKNNKNELYAANSLGKIYRIIEDKAIQLKQSELLQSSVAVSGNNVYDILFRENGNPIFLTFYGEFEFDRNNLLVNTTKQKLTGNSKYTLTNNNGNYLILKSEINNLSEGINEFLLPSKNTIKIIKQSVSSRLRNRYFTFSGRDFLTNAGSLYVIKQHACELILESSILKVKATKNRLWLSTVNGLIELDTNLKVVNEHFKGTQIDDMYEDGQGGFWISTNSDYIYHVDKIEDRSYPLEKPFSLSCFDNKIIVGSSDGIVYEFLNNQFISRFELAKNKMLPKNMRVTRVLKWNDLSIILSKNAVSLLDYSKKKIVFQFAAWQGRFGYEKNKDTFLLFGTTSAVEIYRNGGLNDVNTKIQPRCFSFLGKNSVLIGLENGLYFANRKNINDGKLIEEFRGVRINSIVKLPNSEKVLIATRFNGLFLFDKVIRKIKINFAQIIFELKIEENHLFVSTNQGLFVAKYMDRLEELKWFPIESGEVNDFCVCDDKIYYLNSTSLVIKSWRNYLNTIPYHFQLNFIGLDGIRVKKVQTINYNVNKIEFDFDLFNFSKKVNKLYYIVSGSRNFSSYSSNSKISFENLRKGDYTLQVFPVICGNIDWSRKKELKFKVTAPFWESSGFFILVITSLGLLSYLLITLWRLQQKKKIEKEFEMTNQLLKHKLTALKAQINPHFLSNSLAAIQKLILSNQLNRSTQYLAKFSLLMRKVLNYSEKQFIHLGEELEIIDLYLELELLRFHDAFSVIREFENLDFNELKIPALIMQPTIENAIYHGLRDLKRNNGVLTMRLYKNLDGLIFEIEDNGGGIAVYAKQTTHDSKGKLLVMERIDSLNKMYGQNTCRLEYIDLSIVSDKKGTLVKYFFSNELIENDENY